MSKHKPRKLEWNLIAVFTIGLALWFQVVFPFLQNIADTQGSFVAYSYYVVLIMIISYFIGEKFHRTLETLVLFLVLFVGTDVVQPPIVIQENIVPTTELLNTWGSDTFFYQIGTNFLHLAHHDAWLFTYWVIPIISVVLLAYLLSAKLLKKRITFFFNGG